MTVIALARVAERATAHPRNPPPRRRALLSRRARALAASLHVRPDRAVARLVADTSYRVGRIRGPVARLPSRNGARRGRVPGLQRCAYPAHSPGFAHAPARSPPRA